MSGLDSTTLTKLFEDKQKVIELEASSYKEMRDEWNDKVKQRSEERNGFNLQVQELISEVQIKKSIRDAANQKVKDLKNLRAEHSKTLKEKRVELKAVQEEISETKQSNKEGDNRGNRSPSRIRIEMDQLEQKFERGRLSMNERSFMKRMKELSQELKEAKKNKNAGGSHHELRAAVREAAKVQEEAHNKVEAAVEEAQHAHDIMSRISDEVDKLRDAANESHSGLIRAKREADNMHSRYIVSLKCMHSMSDLISGLRAKEDGSLKDSKDDQTTGVSDIMEQLMSGGTISTDDLLLIQRRG